MDSRESPELASHLLPGVSCLAPESATGLGAEQPAECLRCGGRLPAMWHMCCPVALRDDTLVLYQDLLKMSSDRRQALLAFVIQIDSIQLDLQLSSGSNNSI